MSRMNMIDYYPYYNTGAIFGLLVIWFVFVVVLYVLTAIFLRKLFEKAGVANPNVAWIPVYNILVFAKLGDVNPLAYLAAVGAAAVLSWIPVLGWIIALAPAAAFIMAAYRVNLKLQKDPVPFTIFAALLSLIWVAVVAFGSGVWNTASKPLAGVAPVPPPPWQTVAFFMDTTTWGGVPFQGYAAVPKAPPAAPPAMPPAAPPTAPPSA
jgi:hypothetical protein